MSSCKVYNMKKMDCQIGEKGECGICVKLPCLGSGKCEDVKIECCKPDQLDQCCQTKGANNECCVCLLCQNGKMAKVLVDCCGKRQELTPKSENSVCVCVPQKEGGKCGGQVQIKECTANQVERCCKDNTANGECCCVCLQCDDGGNCQALVCCPTESVVGEQSSAGCCSGQPCCA